MLHLAFFLFRAVLIYCSACPFVVQAKLFADCTFGDMQSSKSAQDVSALAIKFSGQFPSTRNVSHSCLLKTDNRNSLLYIKAKRNKESKEGSLHMTVYATDEAGLSILLGHLDIPKSTAGWNSLPICPSSSASEASDKYLTITGTSGLDFTVEITQEENIKLDERKEFTISPSNRVQVFQFIPNEDITDTQLDVTVTSESADVPAYLKVSRNCKDVKDNINLVDYKGESLRLSFAKKGRITLSKVSVPPLTNSTSSWFIGIARKNATGKTPFDETKTVVLTLTRSFDYMYSQPLNILVFLVSLSVGVSVSLWAWYSFREYIVSPCTGERVSITKLQVTCREFISAMRDVICFYSFRKGTKTYSYITFIVGSVLMVGALQFVFANWYLMIKEGDRDDCYYNDFCYRVRYYDIPYNLMISNIAYVIHGLILAVTVLCMESELLARCTKLAAAAEDDAERINDTYASDQTGPDENQSAQTGRGESQPAQTRPDQNQSAQTGPDQNQSTQTEPQYKHLPNHILICPDISPHLEKMLVPQRTIKNKEARAMFAEARKKRFTFTIGYAFAWALIFEGFFSSLYHLCPSKLTFQFDTAFMFVIASLIVILLYNGIEIKECSINVTDRVAAANFFLYFLVPLYFFNYLGTLYHSEAGLVTSVKIPFLVLLSLWCVFMAGWVSKKLQLYHEILYPVFSIICRKIKCKQEWSRYEPSNGGREGHDEILVKSVKALLCFAGLLVVPIVFPILSITESMDFPELFLFTCIAESLIGVTGKVLVQIIRHFYYGCCAFVQCTCTCQDVVRFISQITYVIVNLVLGIVSLVFFLGKETTDKVKTAEKSRDLNQECFWLDFFDYHDVWHILSSFTLLMGALLVLHVSYKPPTKDINFTSTAISPEESAGITNNTVGINEFKEINEFTVFKT